MKENEVQSRTRRCKVEGEIRRFKVAGKISVLFS